MATIRIYWTGTKRVRGSMGYSEVAGARTVLEVRGDAAAVKRAESLMAEDVTQSGHAPKTGAGGRAEVASRRGDVVARWEAVETLRTVINPGGWYWRRS